MNHENHPLHAAAARADVKACEALLREGAAPDAFSEEGKTALHHAVQAKSLEVCACLLQAGASFARTPEQRDPGYLTPFQLALELNWREGVRFFLNTQGGDPCAARIWKRGDGPAA